MYLKLLSDIFSFSFLSQGVTLIYSYGAVLAEYVHNVRELRSRWYSVVAWDL